MTIRTLIKASEIDCPTTTGAATSFSSATLVRLVNTATSADYDVTVVETQSGTVIGTFTMLRSTVEFLEKNPTECVFAENASVRGAKVGFTN